MTEDEFKEFVDKFNFKHYADIVESNKGCARFDNLDSSCTDSGYVYFWVEKSKNRLEVVYVGKAGRTMRERCNQHSGGFNGGSATGKKHSKHIVDGIKRGKTYHVHDRKSETCEIVAEKEIPMSCIEEIAFIKKLNPPWNSDHE
jgi:hypothetical protein